MTPIVLSALLSLMSSPADTRAEAAAAARDWIAASQSDAGWIPSYGDPEPRQAWTWDQALALLALTPEGRAEAEALVAALVGVQRADGSLPACLDPDTGEVVVDEPHLGAVGLAAFALARYADAAEDSQAAGAARAAAEWLVERQRQDGSVSDSTLANIGAWWGMAANEFGPEARRLSFYLVGKPYERSEYWFMPKPGDRTVVCDVNTMGSLLLTANRQYGMGAAALIYVRTYLFIRGAHGQPGLGITGPVAIWYEGTAQYVAAEGLDSGQFLRTLLSAQNPDGSMPHSDRNAVKGLSWHTTAPSLAATAWLTFAIEGHPFELTNDERAGLRRPGRSIARRGGQEHPRVEQAQGEHDPWE